ncbi:MAG: sigma-70 family RNA polymerase sigma factor [Isosphaeraceae bacterium]
MSEATSAAGVAAPDDETLVGLARRGNRPASDELFLRYRGVAYRVAYRLLGNEQDALDAVQDGLLKAFSGLGDFDGRSRFSTWLVRIVANAAIDIGRKRKRQSLFGIGPGRHEFGNGQAHGREPACHDDPARGLQRQDLRQALDAALGRLSPTIRTTFVLFAEANLSYKEIAEIQRIPIGTVMNRIFRARQKLQSFPELQTLEGLDPT